MRDANRLRYGTHEWTWDASHHPLPLTPAFASVYPRWLDRGFAVAFAQFGVLAETVEARLYRGYLYTRPKPVGLTRTPPAWVAAIGLRLWWLHPGLRRRVRQAVRRVRSDYSTTVLCRWETAWRPAVIAEQRALGAIDLSALGDATLAGHLAHVIRRAGEWVTAHFVLHAAIALPLGALEDFLAASPRLEGVRLADLLQGFSRASSEPARALDQLAAPLRGEPALVARTAALDPADALRELRGASPLFAQELDRYLRRFGQSIAGCFVFIVPTLTEQPQGLVSVI